MFVVAAIPPAWMRRVHWPLYVFVLVSVAAVLAAGRTVNGAARWINVRRVPVPAVGVLEAPADRGPRRAPGVTARDHLAGPADASGARLHRRCRRCSCSPSPTSGRPSCLRPSLMGMLFVYGAPWRHFAWMGLAGAVAHGADLLDPARRRHPRAPELSGRPHDGLPAPRPARSAAERLQPERVDVAIGARRGGGNGVTDATQTLLGYLPEHATDFVFPSSARSAGSSAPRG